MIDCRVSVDIAAPPARVWSVLVDVERWHKWTSSITRIELLDPQPMRPGSRARVLQPGLPAKVWQVNHFDPERGLFHWAAHSPGVTVTGCHLVEPAGPATRATHWLEYTGLLGPLTARLMRKQACRYVVMEAEGLKRRIEMEPDPAT